MKELYNTPVAELIVFAALEKLATGEHSGIPYNDDTNGPATDINQSVGTNPPWAN